MSDLPVILHAGPHKTGSTWLQEDVFPHWDEVAYLGRFDLRSFLRRSPDLPAPDKPLLFSSEAALGYPYPTTQPFDLRTLRATIRVLSVTHVIVVDRDFPSWCLSVYMQYLHEGGSLSLQQFIQKNPALLSWRNSCSVVEVAGNELGVQVLRLSYEDICRDPDTALKAIGGFVDLTPPPVPARIRRTNSSRRGTLTVRTLRWSNSRLPRRFRKLIGLRGAIQYKRLGAVLERASSRSMHSEDVSEMLKNLKPQ